MKARTRVSAAEKEQSSYTFEVEKGCFGNETTINYYIKSQMCGEGESGEESCE